MQDEFKELIEEATFICQVYFVEELLSVYLHGSIAMNDAIPYVSDLDYHVVVRWSSYFGSFSGGFSSR